MTSPPPRLLCALLPLLLLVCSAQASPPRALLALDRVIDGALVAGRNATVHYLISNVGTTAATSVSLKDLSFPSSRFHVHEGTFRPTFASVSGGASLSSRVVLTPRRAGELLVSPAAVTYTDAAGRSHVTRLASADNIVVEDLLAYRRRTDRHATEWGAYAAAFLLFVVAPAAYAALLERGVVVGEGAKKR